MFRRRRAAPATSSPAPLQAANGSDAPGLTEVLDLEPERADGTVGMAGGRHGGSRAWTAYHHRPVMITLRRQKYNIIASRQRIKRMLFIHTSQMDTDTAILQHSFIAQFLLFRRSVRPENIEFPIVLLKLPKEIFYVHVAAAILGYQILNLDILQVQCHSRLP